MAQSGQRSVTGTENHYQQQHSIDDMSYQIGEVSEISRISIRMLRHYDQIGLLVPSGRSDSGYRLYSMADLERLQMIQFFRTLDFPLAEIHALMNAEEYDRHASLLQQRQLLQEKSSELEKVLNLINRVIKESREKKIMELKEMFEAFPEMTPEMMDKSEQIWGHTEQYRESSRRIAGYSKQDWQDMRGEMEDLNRRAEAAFAAGMEPDQPAAIAIAEALRLHIDKWFFTCPRSLHRKITFGNSQDERFLKNIDRNQPGLAVWISQAANANANRHPD
jgi:DNA-binding transcriptional MerR regulator